LKHSYEKGGVTGIDGSEFDVWVKEDRTPFFFTFSPGYFSMRINSEKFYNYVLWTVA